MKKMKDLTLDKVNKITSLSGSSGFKKLKYKKGQILYYEGTRPMGIYFIVSGRIKTYRTTPKGSENILGLANKDSFIGIYELLNQEVYPGSAIMLEESDIIYIPKDIFLRLYNSNRELFQYYDLKEKVAV